MSGVVTASLLPEPVAKRHDEDDLQAAVVAYLGLALPDNALAFHVPNGGLRRKSVAGRLKRLGLLPGVPDLVVIHGGRVFMVELKTPVGGLSAVQRRLHARLWHCGVTVLTCRSGAAVERALADHGVPLKAHFT